MPSPKAEQARTAPFGSVLTDTMAVAHFRDGSWGAHEVVPVAPLAMHPAAHVLHYSSTCFEGFKAYRHPDGSVKLFRMDKHIARLQQSARSLVLPVPDAAQLAKMVLEAVNRVRDDVPDAPGALYLRPLLFGTMPNIGAASTPSNSATLLVLTAPVWDYFSGGAKPLRILVDDVNTRCAAHLGVVKTGGNYAAAMGPTLAARTQYQTDQVLFCPGGEVQETGAANFLLFRDGKILTRSLDRSFLHGVTRDSLLTLAPELGYQVEERVFTVAEMLDWVKSGGEAALSGTAAVLSGIGTLIHRGTEYKIGDGGIGPHTQKLRAALVGLQQGLVPDTRGWLTTV